MRKNRKIEMGNPVNPFVINSGIPVYLKNTKAKTMVDLKTVPKGEEILENPDLIYIKEKYLVDAVQHTKLFYSIGCAQRVKTLSRYALIIFFQLAYRTQHNQDLMQISTEKYSKDLEVSTTTISKALQELVEHSFIAKFKGSYYWINPHFFFHGNRMKKYENYLVKAESIKEQI